MKRTMLSLCAAAIGAISALGQTALDSVPAPSRFGVMGAFELSIPSGSHGAWDTGSGASLLAYYRLPLTEHFDFVPAIGGYYSTMGADYLYSNGATYDGTVKSAGIRIPLSVAYHFAPSQAVDVGIATGPWININLYARHYAMPAPMADPPAPRSANLMRYGVKRVEALWGLVLSVTFKEHYTVGITTGVAFTPLASFGNRDNKIRIRRNTIALSLGYNF